MSNRNLLLVGHGRCGKDSAAGALHRFGRLRMCGSLSWFALPYIAKELDIPQQIAWETRHDNRMFWYEYCNHLRREDPLFLVRLALQHGNVVTGLRDSVEMDSAKASGLFERIVWIQRPGTPEDPTVKFKSTDCTETLVNDFSSAEGWAQAVRDWAEANDLTR